MTNRRATIVGGAGFLGSAIARRLTADGFAVRVIDTPERLARSRRLRPAVTQSLEVGGRFQVSPAALADTDTLFHLAWTSIPSTSMQNISGEIEDNVLGSVRLLEQADAAGVRRVVFFSSGGAVYGGWDTIPVTETSPTRPRSVYGISKRTVEQFLQLFSTNGSYDAYMLRISNPYGPYQLAGTPAGVIASFIGKAQRKEPLVIWGDGSIVRDYLYIDDFEDAISALTRDRSVPGGIYNLGSGQGTSLNELISEIRAVTPQPFEVQYTAQRNFDAPRVMLDVSKFCETLNWRARTSLRDGVGHMWSAADQGVKPEP